MRLDPRTVRINIANLLIIILLIKLSRSRLQSDTELPWEVRVSMVGELLSSSEAKESGDDITAEVNKRAIWLEGIAIPVPLLDTPGGNGFI